MKSFVFGMVFLVLSGLAGSSVLKAQDVFFMESFDNPALLTNRWWSGTPIVTETHGSGQALMVSNAVVVSRYLTTTLPTNTVQALAGRRVVIKAQVKAANISTKLNPWNGIKVMLVYTTSDGITNAPQINLTAGTFDWTDGAKTISMPSNVTSAKLFLGLENVSGTAWFNNVQIAANPVAFEETFDNPGSLTNTWAGAPIVTEAHGSGWALKVSNPAVGSQSLVATLPVNALKGHRVVITAHAKAVNISAKLNPWDGIKVQLQYVTSDGALNYSDIVQPTGTFDWTHAHTVARLPGNVTSASLLLGLENVSGTTWFDDVRVEVDPVLVSENFDSPSSLSSRWWSGTPIVTEAHGSGQALKATNPSVSSQYLISTLPPDTVQALAGRRVVIKAQVKAGSISAKPNPWNGIKMMLVYTTSDGVTNAPQIYLPTGTFDWTDVADFSDLPNNVTSAKLFLGLENVSGTVWFDDLSVNAVGELFDWNNPTPNYKGHSVSALRGAGATTKLQASDVSTLAGWNANVVRWVLGASDYPLGLTTTNYDQVMTSELAKLDAVLPALQGAGILVVLNLHSLSQHQFDSPAAQAKLISTWKMLANRYKNNSTIWAYDIANEPVDGVGLWLNWNELAEQVALNIRDVDPKKTIIIEAEPWGDANGMVGLRPARTSNVVYSFHWYEPHEYTHQGIYNYTATWTYPGLINGKTWNSARMLNGLSPVIQFQKKYNVSIYVGEFSVLRWAPGGDQWLADSIALFEQQGWDWCYFTVGAGWNGWNLTYGPNRYNPSETLTAADGGYATDRLGVVSNSFINNVRPAQ